MDVIKFRLNPGGGLGGWGGKEDKGVKSSDHQSYLKQRAASTGERKRNRGEEERERAGVESAHYRSSQYALG